MALCEPAAHVQPIFLLSA